MSGRKIAILLKEPESYLLSLARDITSTGFIVGGAWFVNTQMPPSAWINAALAIAWMLWMMGRSTVTKLTAVEARAWLDEHHPITNREG